MFEFGEYRLRETTTADHEHCRQWIAADDYHRGQTTAEFFTTPEAAIEKMVLEDREGNPIFYYRQERALRFHMQFGPTFTKGERVRHAQALIAMFGFVKRMAEATGYRELISNTEGPELMGFASKRFGFTASEHEVVCGLNPVGVTEQG